MNRKVRQLFQAEWKDLLTLLLGTMIVALVIPGTLLINSLYAGAALSSAASDFAKNYIAWATLGASFTFCAWFAAFVTSRTKSRLRGIATGGAVGVALGLTAYFLALLLGYESPSLYHWLNGSAQTPTLIGMALTALLSGFFGLNAGWVGTSSGMSRYLDFGKPDLRFLR